MDDWHDESVFDLSAWLYIQYNLLLQSDRQIAMFARFISAMIVTVSLLIGIFATSADILPFGLSLYKKPLNYASGGNEPSRSGYAKINEMIQLANVAIEGKNHFPVYKYEDLGTLPYSDGIGIKRQGPHAGQRKLLLTEIEFLTCCAVNTSFVIYAGSAPCEKLPILLQMFPDKKFLLIDPNFHSFYAPDANPQIVYQNIDRIGSETLANTRKDLKLRNKSHLNTEDTKRLQNISLQLRPTMYKSKYRGDMSLVTDSAHMTAMREIQHEFEINEYKNLTTDIIRGESRVYVIQDYMTESLCKLIYESIQIADTELKSPTHICFISDLRTNFFGSAPIDLDFMWNDSLQLIFLKLLQPNFSMLKFHPPYYDRKTSIPLIAEMEAGSVRHGIFPIISGDLKTCREQYGLDFLALYKGGGNVYKYIKSSNIWLQAWGPTSSSEARLIISKADISAPYQEYNAGLWDDRFQYSKIMRGYAYYGALYESIKHLPDNTYDGCFDCALEMIVLLNYAFRTQAPSSNSTIDVPKLVEILKTPSAQSTLIALQKQIDSVVIYPVTQKCFFHGQVTKPLEQPVFYEHEYSPNKTNWVNQVYVANGKIERKKAIIYDCKTKPPSSTVEPGIKFALGKNVPSIARRDIDRYIKSGFAYCNGEHRVA